MDESMSLSIPHTIQLEGGSINKRREASSKDKAMTAESMASSPLASSPSSVLAMISSLPENTDKELMDKCCVRSFVMMDDAGAELVAEFDNLSIATSNTSGSTSCKTPKKALRSLLDDEQSGCYTPTPPASRTGMELMRTTPNSSEAALCCYFDCFNNNKNDVGKFELVKLQTQINALLGDKAFFKDWQMWSFFGTAAIPKHVHKVKEEEVKKALRNRAFSIAERARRMDSVRRDLSPFSLTPKRYKRSPVKLGKAKSFDITEHGPEISRGKENRHSSNGNFVSIFERASCFCDTTTKGDSPAIIRSHMLHAVNEDICYDSDPEDFTRRRSRGRKPTAPSALHQSLTVEDDDNSNKENMLSSYSPMALHYPHSYNEDDFAIYHMVQEFMNERLTLILHTKGPAERSSSPHAVKAWFERGQHLSCNSVIQPRFMWHLVHRQSKKCNVTVPNSDVSSFCLVDVARVLAVDSVDRKLYPFAKSSSCFHIKTLDKSLLFEAKSATERERIIRLFKLVVARLGSKLIVGDQSFFAEYFVSTESGPGEAPIFFN